MHKQTGTAPDFVELVVAEPVANPKGISSAIQRSMQRAARRSKKPTLKDLLPPDQSFGYRGYWAVHLPDDNFSIQKDGFHIGYAKSADAARATIDLVA